MNRKQLLIIGIILVSVVVVFAVLLNLFSRTDNTNEDSNFASVSEIAYCNEEQVKPCVVSFGVDADNNMLVNFLLPDLSFPDFYLQIVRGDISISYQCQRITGTLNNAYCIGEKLPPGETLQLILISRKNDEILAQGSLSILGLAFPTLEIVTPTLSIPSTIAATDPSDFVLPTGTPTRSDYPSPLETPTQPSYPNKSYP